MKTLFDPEPRFARYMGEAYMFDGTRIFSAAFRRTAWLEIGNYTNEKFERFLQHPGVQEVYEDPIRR
jgi:hypothetical protein